MPSPTQQLLSQTIYATDGLTSDWNFSFADGYLDVSHVKAYYLDSGDVRTELTTFTLSGPYQIHTASPLPAGLRLVIYRDTPKTAPLVNFTDGSGLTELALDTNARQAVMLAAEAADSSVNSTTITATQAAGQAAASALAAGLSATAASGSASSANASAVAAAASAAEAIAAATAGTLATAESLAASSGASVVGYLPAGTGAVATNVQSKLRESVSVLDFGADPTGIDASTTTAAIRKAITYANTGVNKKLVLFPPGKYSTNEVIDVPAGTCIVGTCYEIGYLSTVSNSCVISPSTSISTVFNLIGPDISIRNIAILANNLADYGIYASAGVGIASRNYFDTVVVNKVNKTGIYLNQLGLTKIHNSQVSECVECGLDLANFGDADISNVFINTINQDSTSTVNGPSTSSVYGVGIRLRLAVGGTNSGNVNIRGGKIEYCRIGILCNAVDGVNISGINFDVCKKASIYIASDAMNASPDITTPNTYTCTSIQITGNRFLGGIGVGGQLHNSHIYVEYARFITIVGNGFKRSNNNALDFGGAGGAQGPSYGIHLYNAELCTVVGNDLYGAATTHCVVIEHATPSSAQHTFYNNTLDGTELINPGMVGTQPYYGSINFASNMTPNAKNTTKAWVRFNGSGPAPVIIDSFGVSGVTGAGGTYTVTGASNWGINAAVNVSARNWFAASDSANYGAVTANTVTVYSTTAGALSSNGDITVVIFAA